MRPAADVQFFERQTRGSDTRAVRGCRCSGPAHEEIASSIELVAQVHAAKAQVGLHVEQRQGIATARPGQRHTACSRGRQPCVAYLRNRFRPG